MPYSDMQKQRASQHASYLRTKAAYLLRTEERRKQNQEYVVQYKAAHPCACGETACECLVFHHVAGKDNMITKAIHDWALVRLKKEVEKCRVLCANCHRKLHCHNGASTTTNRKRIRNRLFVAACRRAGCSNCSETNPRCLDFHHCDGKQIMICEAICDWGLPRLKEEIAKCRVLCANCHARETQKLRCVA